jgi:hypothetical protein
MNKTRAILFAELRRFLVGLGFTERRSPSAHVFQHPKEGLVLFRLYGADETVDQGDVVSTRKFLDLRGLLDAGNFDTALQQTSTPA